MTLNEGSQPLVTFHKEKVKPIQMTKTPTPVVSTSEAQVRSAISISPVSLGVPILWPRKSVEVNKMKRQFRMMEF